MKEVKMLKKCQDEEWKIYAEWGLDLPPISVQLKIINQAESDKAMKNEAAIISMLSIYQATNESWLVEEVLCS